MTMYTGWRDGDTQDRASSRKYRLVPNPIESGDRTLYMIEAVKSFSTNHGMIRAGDIGGLVESEDNLSQEGSCWITRFGTVYGNARVTGSARVGRSAENLWDKGRTEIGGNTLVTDDAVVEGHVAIDSDSPVRVLNDTLLTVAVLRRSSVHCVECDAGRVEVRGRTTITGVWNIYNNGGIIRLGSPGERAVFSCGGGYPGNSLGTIITTPEASHLPGRLDLPFSVIGGCSSIGIRGARDVMHLSCALDGLGSITAYRRDDGGCNITVTRRIPALESYHPRIVLGTPVDSVLFWSNNQEDWLGMVEKHFIGYPDDRIKRIVAEAEAAKALIDLRSKTW